MICSCTFWENSIDEPRVTEASDPDSSLHFRRAGDTWTLKLTDAVSTLSEDGEQLDASSDCPLSKAELRR